ncbi:MAG TPA: hypothetical protein VMS30_07735 [Phycisphaerales bacterium]|nr:hypothetical protein [Phycisphaerales bacterium]
MHTFRVSTSMVVITLSGMLILSAGGCEDSAAKQRDQVQAQLAQIRTDLQKTLATGGESYEADLNKIVSQLSSLSGGEPGQQTAKSMLAANTLREVATVKMAAASDIEAQHRAALGAVNARIDAAMRIQSLAQGLESIDAAKRRGELQADLQQAMDGVTAAQAKMTELESPINERTSQNTAQKAEMEQLRVQVGDLLKQAQTMGYSAGFETYKQATQVGRQADRIEYEVSNREIDLEHELNPQHKAAQSQKAQLESLAQAIESAQAELDAFAAAASGDAQASHAKVAEFSKKISDDMSSIKATADGDLKTAYDDGRAALEKAAASALAASTGGSDASAGRTLACAVSESMVRLHLLAAHGLSDRVASLQRIKASNGAIAFNGADAQIKELSDARQQHLSAATTSLDEAKQAADSIAGDSSEIQALRTNLQALSAAVSGKPAAPSAPATGDASGASGNTAAAPAAPSAPATAGAESPDALVASLNSIKSLSNAGKIFDLTLPPTDPVMQGVMTKFRALFDGVASLDSALQAKFNKSVTDMKGSNMGEMSMIANATLKDATETAGSVDVTDSKGKTTTMPITKVGERWYIGSPEDDNAAMSIFGMGNQRGEAATPDAQQMGKQMVIMMSGMFATMGQAMSELATSVQAGEFATFEDFQKQADERMNKIMQQAMGGVAGRPPTSGGAEPNK